MSLIKFMNRTERDGNRLHWGRAEHDGLPFRGPQSPMYTEEEYEAKVKKVADSKEETFDLRDANQRRLYLDICDGINNGWFQLVYIERFRDQLDPLHRYVTIEWVEFYMEDGTRSRYSNQGILEVANAPRNYQDYGPQ